MSEKKSETEGVWIRSQNAFLVMNYIRNHLSEELLQDILLDMALTSREHIESTGNVSSNIPLESYQSFLKTFREKSSEEDFLACADHMTRVELEGSHRFVAQDLSQDGIIARMFDMWNLDFNTGNLRLLVVSEELSRVQVEDFPMNEAHRVYLGQCIKHYVEHAVGGRYSMSTESRSEQDTIYTFVREAEEK